MHAVEDEGHDEEVAVLETDDVPLVLRSGLVRVNISEEAEGKDDDPQVDPSAGHHDVNYFDVVLSLVLGLHEGTPKCNEDIAHVMYDEYHGPRSYLIAHHREKYKRSCHAMMKQQLVKLPLGLPLDDDHLKHRKEVHSELYHEVHL